MNQDRRDFLKTTGALACASFIVPAWATGCGGDSFEENPTNAAKAANLEALGTVLTMAEPGMWADKIGGHLPMATFTAGDTPKVEVKVDHGMSAEHYIVTIYAKDQDGKVIGLTEFKGTDPTPVATYDVPSGTTSITGWAYCNLHSHWKDDGQTVSA